MKNLNRNVIQSVVIIVITKLCLRKQNMELNALRKVLNATTVETGHFAKLYQSRKAVRQNDIEKDSGTNGNGESHASYNIQ